MKKEELEKWAKETLQVYHGFANHDWSKIPAFYTQSDLTKAVGVNSIDVFIAGINPGSSGTYQDMINNPNSNWGINPEIGMTPQQLISGNFCKHPDKGGLTSWQLHDKWDYFKRLKGYFSLVNGGNPLDDEKRFILTNASFLATCKACQLPKASIQQTILCTIELINMSSPKRIVFLSGKATFNVLMSIKSDKLKFEKKSEANDILHGYVNGIPCLGLPHPSAYLTSERRKEIALILKEFFETGELNLNNSIMVNTLLHKNIINKVDLISEAKKVLPQNDINQWYEKLRYRFCSDLQATFDKDSINIRFFHPAFARNFVIANYDGTQQRNIIDIITKDYGFKGPETSWIGRKQYFEYGNDVETIVNAIKEELASIVKKLLGLNLISKN